MKIVAEKKIKTKNEEITAKIICNCLRKAGFDSRYIADRLKT